MVEVFVFLFFRYLCNKCAFTSQKKVSPGQTHKEFQMTLAREILQKSELQQNSNPSPGRPF